MRFWGRAYDVTVNVASWGQLEKNVVSRMRSGEGFSIATINLDHLVKLRSNAKFQTAYTRQDFVVADGHPIVWLSNIADRSVGLIPGSDAVLPLTRIAAVEGKRIALVGSTEKTLLAAKAYLEDTIADVDIGCTIAPPYGFDPDGDIAQSVLDELADHNVDLVFLALGAPKQELFAARASDYMKGVGFVSIGAGLDFFAGSQVRAPQWVRTIAMEWLWRMLSDPLRMIPRYIKCFAILPTEIVHALQLRRKPSASVRSPNNGGGA